MPRLARRATQCAIEIQRSLDQSDDAVACFSAGSHPNDDVGPGRSGAVSQGGRVNLSVKIGVGVGDVAVLHVGGDHGRAEYVAVGDPLDQAFGAEHHGAAGHVVCAAARPSSLRTDALRMRAAAVL